MCASAAASGFQTTMASLFASRLSYSRPTLSLYRATMPAFLHSDFVRNFTPGIRAFSHTAGQLAYPAIIERFFPPGRRAWIKEKIANSRGSLVAFGKSGNTLKNASLVMYGCCTDPLNHLHFFKVLDLPDTFNSWHKITELHVWMCMVRLSNESFPGQFTKNKLVEAFWKDVDKRSQQLGPEVMANRKKGIGQLADQFRAAIFGYDEGLLSDDKVLAGAVWRHFFGRNCDDPRKIELLVLYIRTQIENLEAQDREMIFSQGIIRWLALTDLEQ